MKKKYTLSRTAYLHEKCHLYQLVEQDDSDFSVRLPHIHGAIIGRVAAPKIYIEPELQSQCRQIISKVSKPTHDPNWVEEWEIFVFETGVSHENYQEINGVRNFFSDKETAEKYL